MRKYIYIILVLSLNFSFAQKEQAVYLSFNSKNDEFCQVQEKDRGRYHAVENTKKYLKIEQKNGEIDFYICKELFTSKKEIDTCDRTYLNKIKISKIEELKKVVDKTNPLYPDKVFPNLYLVEELNDTTIIKHKVRWKYYIE
ncbi:hypothetical protein [Formosa sp. PL04]|uniref:hypothetical protein n=1 Tax=Formosa sp. PL04 TaxID=3081755 RepID=UPI0029829F10|nr:hypothetical protein [Formosa sp. PL04]MDW5290834.1 hypothetical protein [Formosa sp. PL04]